MTTMAIDWLKTTVEAYPRLNDAVKAWRKPETPLEHWIEQFSRRQRPVRFIQIGANEGLHWDPYRQYIVRDRWQGLLVEPQPTVFAELQRNYAYLAGQGLTCVNAAISATEGTLDFWTFDEAFLVGVPKRDQLGLLAFASFDPEQVLRNVPARFGDVRAHLKAIPVQTLTVDALLREHWRLRGDLDLLTVDAEGHDETILRSIDFTTIRPRAIIYEAHNLEPEARAGLALWLNGNGYRVTRLRGDVVAERR